MIPFQDGFDLQRNVIIIDDVKYDYAPDSLVYGYNDGYGVVGDTVLTAGLTRVSQVQTVTEKEGWWSVEPSDTEPTNKLSSNSVSQKMAWTMNWNQNSPMNLCMRDHLFGLSVTQRPFWLQFDEEMSRESEKLFPISEDNMTYQLPTNPVAYFTTATDTADNTYNVYPYIQIFDQNNDPVTSPVFVNEKTGVIRLVEVFQYINVKYLWRAFVRVKAISLDPIQWAQNVYGGTVIFEQVATEPMVERFDNKYRLDSCIQFDEEVGEVDDSTIIKTNCPSLYTDVKSITKGIAITTCTSTDETYNTGSVTIPNSHYITGVEIIDLVGGRQLHCVTPLTETVVKSRLKFNTGTAPVLSSFYEKQSQTDAIQNHAIINNVTVPAGDISYGGAFDLFGKPVGVYRGSDMVNGITFNNVITIPSTSNCNAYTGATSAVTNGLTSYTKKDGSTVSPTSSSGYSIAGTTITLPMVELTDSAASAAFLEAYVDGSLTFDVTGSATARMTTVRLQLSVTLESTAPQTGRTYTLVTSLGEVTIPSDDITKTINLDKTFVVNLTAGAGQLIVPLYYYVKTSFDANAPGQTNTYKAKVSGSLTYTMGYGCASSPSINNFGVRIHHAPSCPTTYKYHTTASGTGSSSTATPILGLNGTTMRSSDGTTSGVGELYCRDFNWETFNNDSLLVGAIAKFSCRRVGVPGVASNLITNGNFNAGNTGFTTEYSYNLLDGSGNLDEAGYSVVTNPNSIHSLWYGFTDHTADVTAKMLVVNGEQGTTTVSGDWSFTVSPGTSNTSGASPLTHSSSHVITATYIGSSPTLPETVKVAVPHTFDLAGMSMFVTPDDTVSFSADSSLGLSYSYFNYGPPYRNVTETKEVTISLTAGVGTYTLEMDSSAGWTAASSPTATITHSVGIVTLVESAIPSTKYFWKQVLTLTPSTTYTFEYYARKINSAASPNADPIVKTTVNGTTVNTTTITNTSGWTKVTFTYTTGVGTSYDFRMIMPSGATPGNDIAIDDISLVGAAGLCKLYMHVGSESSGNPFKEFTLPNTDTWVDFEIGGVEDMWGYSSTFSEIPRQYPTSDGSNINNWFSISFNQTNNSGGYYEFKGIRTQLFLLNPPNTGTILE